MKKRVFSAALIAVFILSGCGASNKTSDTYVSDTNSFSTASTAEAESGGFMDYDYTGDISEEEYWYSDSIEVPSMEMAAAEPEEEAAGNSGSAKDSGMSAGPASGEIEREMLVYSCSMSIDTLDFSSTLDGFHTLLAQYGGFIEIENYDDGGSTSRWYSNTMQKWQSYSATVRVPSRNYDAFCNSAGTLGDLRSKNASVQNLSSEYNDLSTSLEIYEAKEERYIALLADITEDEYAVAIERELTELQIQIAAIKSRMNKIDTDVTYSYIYITINEVKEYVSEPVKTDTFFDRLGNTLSDTGRDFVEFLETLLFLIIRLLPYLVLIVLLIIIILFLTRKRRAHRRNLRQQQAAQTVAQTAQIAPASPAADSTDHTGSAGSTDHPDGAGSANRPDGAGSANRPDGTGSTNRPDGTGSANRPDGTGSAD